VTAMATLVCSVGIAELTEISYEFAGQRYKSRFAPAALAKLHPDLQNARVLVLLTKEARRKWLVDLKQEFARVGIPKNDVKAVGIPLGRTVEEIRDTFLAIARKIRDDEQIYLDVTFSLRHLPFIYLAALTYLTAYRSVNVMGIYYGAYELRREEVAPILDVTELFRLIQWYHALQTAVEDANLTTLAKSLRRDVAALMRSGGTERAISKAKDKAERLAEEVANGLPLGIGRAAAELLAATRGLEDAAEPGLLALERLRGRLEKLAYPEDQADDELSERELKRQLEVAKWYLDQNRLPTAMLLLREWLVNLTILRLQGPNRWLEEEERLQAEAYLNGLARRFELHLPVGAEANVARTWQAIRARRNRLAHAGMSLKDQGRTTRKDVEKLLSDCQELLRDAAAFRATVTPESILISPLGLSPGVLYTLLSRLRPPPPRLIVITSAEGRRRLHEALDHAEVRPELLVRELADPHTGYGQAKELLVDKDLLTWLSNAKELIVNLAGGTTVMQYVVERVAGEARRLGIRVRRVATIDRRTPEEQRGDPYVLGELIKLDVEAGERGDDDDR